MFVACPGTICLVLIVSFRWVISTLFWKFYCWFSCTAQYFISLYGSRVLFTCTAQYFWFSYTAQYFFKLYCSILRSTLRLKSFVHLYCPVLLVQLHSSISLFSYTAQYFCPFILLNNLVHLYSSALFACAQFLCITDLWFVGFNQRALCQPTQGAKGSVYRIKWTGSQETVECKLLAALYCYCYYYYYCCWTQ
jgi:hypothetical protein